MRGILDWLARFFKHEQDTLEEIDATIISWHRSADGATYSVTFRENGGHERTFVQTFELYGPDGMSAPKPSPGFKAKLRVDEHGRIVYAGSAG